MSFSKVKTTYEESDMNRLTRAPQQKICAFYEQKGSYQPVFDQKYDSGFSEIREEPSFESQFSGRPEPPKLLGIVDTENGDSGVCMDHDDTVEPDRVGTQTANPEPKPETHNISPPQKSMENLTVSDISSINTQTAQQQQPSPLVVTQTQKPPRRPRVNYSTMVPASSTNNGSVPTTVQAGRPASSQNVTYTTNNQSIQSARISRGPTSLPTTQNSRELDNVRRRNERNQPASLPAPVNSTNGFSASPVPRIDIFELQRNVQYFLPNRDGDTGFHLAVIHNLDDVMDKLLYIMSRETRLQPVVDEQNGLYQTALHLATHTQQTEMIRKLLIAGAALNITDHKGNTPLHIASQFNSTKALEEILRYVSLRTVLEVAQIRNNEGQTCVHIAAKQGNTDTLRKLKSLGVNMDMQEYKSGRTPLHLVVENNSLSSVQFLLETCHANINATTYSGCTPLHIASGRGSIDIVAYLLSMGADPDVMTDEGDTALELSGSDKVMTLLTKAAALRWLL